MACCLTSYRCGRCEHVGRRIGGLRRTVIDLCGSELLEMHSKAEKASVKSKDAKAVREHPRDQKRIPGLPQDQPKVAPKLARSLVQSGLHGECSDTLWLVWALLRLPGRPSVASRQLQASPKRGLDACSGAESDPCHRL